MKIFLLLLIFSANLSAEDFPLSKERVVEIEGSLQEWRNIVANQSGLNDHDYLNKLGLGLRKTSRQAPYSVGDRLGVHEAIRDKMLGIAGHAEYFGNKITDSYDGIKQGYAEGKREIGEAVGWSGHLKESQYAFETLSLLPSPETVRVLGEMLLDDWKWPDYDDPKTREMVRSTLGVRALSAMSKLPIANPPTKKLQAAEEFEENIGAWKQWYQEIKDGRRTFRFKGDPVHYDLRGPSKRGEVLPNTSRSGKRANTSDEAPASQSTERQASRFLPYLLGFLFVAAGLVYYFKKRTTRA